ncbi:hypothetical protein GJ496_009912 [Pomphorhynchus laevis]|nr:hypothetical protein GJ496_009912 [Pomphorhynchus laevis]
MNTKSLKLQETRSGILDVVESLKMLIELRLQQLKKCHMPNSFYYNGSCFFRSSVKLEELRWLTNTSKDLLPTGSYHNAAIHCERKNGTLAILHNAEEFSEVLNWIIHSENKSLSQSQSERSKIIIGISLQNGRLTWNNDVILKENDFAKFSYSYERGKRLECPVLDISLTAHELPMFVTVRCNENLPILCRKVVNRCHNSPCKVGQCLNINDTFTCKCPILYSGDLCQLYSSEAIQTLSGLIIILTVLLVTFVNWIKVNRNERIKKKQIKLSMKPTTEERAKQNYYCLTNNTDLSGYYSTAKATSCQLLIHSQNKTADSVKKCCVHTNNTDTYDCLFNSTSAQCPYVCPRHQQSSISANPHNHHYHKQQQPIMSSSQLITGQLLSDAPKIKECTIEFKTDFIKKINRLKEFSPQSGAPSFSRKLIEMSSGLISIALSVLCCSIIYRARIKYFLSMLNSSYNNKSHISSNNPENQSLLSVCNLFKPSWLNSVYKLPTTKLTMPSYALLILLIFVMTKRKNHTWLFCGYGSVPVVFDPFSKIKRFESAAVFGILALEISHIFDEFIFHAYRYISHGPLLDLLKQTGLVILIGARYFPILACLELKPSSAICYGFTACYMWMEVGVKAIHDILCPDQLRTNILNHTESMFIRISNLTNIGDNLTKLGTTKSIVSKVIASSTDKIFFKMLKQFPYYAFSIFIASRLTCLSILTMYDSIYPYIERQCNRFKKVTGKFSNEYVLQQQQRSSLCIDQMQYWKEYKYVQYLLRGKQSKNQDFKQCLWFRIVNTFYSYHPYFAYSKQIINIYAIAFTLVYYFTFWTLEQSHGIIDKVFRFIRFLFFYTFSQSLTEDKLKTFDSFRERLRSEVVNDLRVITSLTGLLCLIQLTLGLKQYQRQMLQAYRGNFHEIPNRRMFKPGTLVAKALHYPGYMVGYLIWGYLFMLGTIFTVTIIVRNLIRFFDVFEYLAKWIVPMVILLLMKFLLISVLSRTAFTQWKGQTLALKNTRCIFIFNYFNFFFDCFLGLIMCISRISQASLAAVFLLSRLDYSMFGRSLERYDRGFASYVCWLHLEEIQTHPALIVFCQVVREKIVNRRMETSKLNHQTPMENRLQYERHYVKRQLIIMKYCLLITLARNESLRRFRKHRLPTNKGYQSIGLKKIISNTLKKIKGSPKDTLEVRYLCK